VVEKQSFFFSKTGAHIVTGAFIKRSIWKDLYVRKGSWEERQR